MFEGEKNGSTRERKSLLSFSRGGSEAAREHAGPLSSSDHAEDPQSRHRVARLRREARHNAMLEALAEEDRFADEAETASPYDEMDSLPEPQDAPAAEEPVSPAPPPASDADEPPRPAGRLKDFVWGWKGRSRDDAVDPPVREVAPPVLEAVSPAPETAPPVPEAASVAPIENAPVLERRDSHAGRRQDDWPVPVPAAGSEIWTPLIDPVKVIGRVFDSKLLIVSTTVLGALIGVAIALSTPKKYEAITQLLVDPRDLKLSERELTGQNLPSDATLAIVENQTHILMSSTVLAKVVEREKLASDPEFNGEGKSFGIGAFIAELRSILSRGDNEASNSSRREMIAVEKLGRALSVERTGKSFVISIGVSTEDPQKSAAIANAMTDVYLETYGQFQSQTAGRAADELANRLDELRKGVEEAERKVAAFKAENDIIDPQGRPITDDEIVKLNEQLSTARAHTLELNAKAASVRDVDVDAILGGAIPESISSNIITELRSQYAMLKNESDRMAVRLGPRHPERQAAGAQLAGARGEIAAELRRIASSIQVELKRAVELEQQLAQRLAQLKVRQGDLSGELVQLRELEREASTKRAVYESYLLRARETGEQRGINTANTTVLSPASPPLEPGGPSRAMITLAGAFLGFASGIGFAMMRGAYESLRDRRDARRGRPQPQPPHPDGGGVRPRGPADGFAPSPSTQQPSNLVQDNTTVDHAFVPRAQEQETPSQEDSAMLTHSPDSLFAYPHELPAHPAQQPGWAPYPAPTQAVPAYAEPVPAHAAYPQPQMYPPQHAPYAPPQPAYPQAAGGYPQPMPVYPQAPAYQAPYAWAPQPVPQMPPALWQGQPRVSHPGYAPAPVMPQHHQSFAAPAYPQQPHPYPQAVAQAPAETRPAAQTIPFPVRHVQAVDAPQPVSQTLTEQDSSRAIADIRASLAEFREAVRDFTESRQKRRFF